MIDVLENDDQTQCCLVSIYHNTGGFMERGYQRIQSNQWAKPVEIARNIDCSSTQTNDVLN